MKTLFVIPLLTLFGVPLAWAEDGWYSNRSPYAVQTVTVSSANNASSTFAAASSSATKPLAKRLLTHQRTRLPEKPETRKKIVASTATPVPATSTAPAPVNTLPQALPSDFVSATESAVLRLTNAERTSRGLSPLQDDARLSVIARAHSADMGVNDFFDHENLSGCSSSCRATNAGYAWRAIGENIYMMSGYSLSPASAAEKIVQGWMNSPGHRANVLAEHYSHAGVGLWSDGKSVYATGMYARPR